MSKKKRRQNQRRRTLRQQKKNARASKPRPAATPPPLKLPERRPPERRPEEPVAAPEENLQRWSRLLNKAAKDPEIVLEDRRCLKPYFVERFFALCDAKALEAPSAAPDFADAALKLAEKLGDRHQVNTAQGIAVHAEIAGKRWIEADQRLRGYRPQAFTCCTACASDWLRRHGDLMVETLDPRRARVFLKLAARVLGADLDDDARGRILFIRGIAHYYLKHRKRAIADAGRALNLLSLETPPPYFMDAIAMLACFLDRSGKRRFYLAARAHLDRLGERIKGLKGRQWLEVRDRLRWVRALIDAWLGHPRRARQCLERVRAKHVKHSPHRYALAIALDEALVYCLHLPDVHIRSIRGILLACQRQLKLEPGLQLLLCKAVEALDEADWRAREILVGLRGSFIVPVPGLLIQRVTAAAAAER